MSSPATIPDTVITVATDGTGPIGSDDDTEYDSEGSVGSLVDFIADDDASDAPDVPSTPDNVAKKRNPASELDPSLILPPGARRSRRAAARYVHPDMADLMLKDVPAEEVVEALGTEEDDDVPSSIVTAHDDEAEDEYDPDAESATEDESDDDEAEAESEDDDSEDEIHDDA